MSETWGRTAVAGTWPHPKPVWTLATAVAAMLVGIALGAWRYATIWTPRQRAYFPVYVRSAVMADLGITTAGRYRLPQVVDVAGRGVVVAWDVGAYPHARLHTFLRHGIYRDQTFADLVMPSLWASLGTFAIGLLVAVPKDLARARERRLGRRLKGPQLMTVAQFQRCTRADGIGFLQRPRPLRRPVWVCIPRALESSHLLIMGDSGTGKSALIRQLLRQVEDRGETAIVYDPALEYTAHFYDAARGDVILNPLDARSPYWSPGDEWRHEAETLTLATSLFPDATTTTPFSPKRRGAFLPIS